MQQPKNPTTIKNFHKKNLNDLFIKSELFGFQKDVVINQGKLTFHWFDTPDPIKLSFHITGFRLHF